MPEEECPFCGARVSGNMSDHIRKCPTLLVKRSPQIAIPPGKAPYEEGELPEHLKEVLRRKGSFLTEAKTEVE